MVNYLGVPIGIKYTQKTHTHTQSTHISQDTQVQTSMQGHKTHKYIKQVCKDTSYTSTYTQV